MNLTLLADEGGDIHLNVLECFACKGRHADTPLLRLEKVVVSNGVSFPFRFRCPDTLLDILVWLPPDPRSNPVATVSVPPLWVPTWQPPEEAVEAGSGK